MPHAWSTCAVRGSPPPPPRRPPQQPRQQQDHFEGLTDRTPRGALKQSGTLQVLKGEGAIEGENKLLFSYDFYNADDGRVYTKFRDWDLKPSPAAVATSAGNNYIRMGVARTRSWIRS